MNTNSGCDYSLTMENKGTNILLSPTVCHVLQASITFTSTLQFPHFIGEEAEAPRN